jgi:hypothetical protein
MLRRLRVYESVPGSPWRDAVGGSKIEMENEDIKVLQYRAVIKVKNKNQRQ